MTTGPTDVKVTTAAGGPDGMPLALKLNEGLGITGRDARGVASLAYPQVSLCLEPRLGVALFWRHWKEKAT